MKMRVALGLGHLLDAEVFLHRLEVDIGVAGEVIGDDEVGLRHDFIARLHMLAARDAGEDFLGDRIAHGGFLSVQLASPSEPGFIRPFGSNADLTVWSSAQLCGCSTLSKG